VVSSDPCREAAIPPAAIVLITPNSPARLMVPVGSQAARVAGKAPDSLDGHVVGAAVLGE
jgi:hypothetical protein